MTNRRKHIILLSKLMCLMLAIAMTSCVRVADKKDKGLHKEVNGFLFDLHLDEDDLLRFVLKIAKDNGEDFFGSGGQKKSQEELVYYFSYRFDKDIYLLHDGKKIHTALYHFERSYDLKTSRSFVFAFDYTSELTEELTLVIDSEILGIGQVRFDIDLDKMG